jgi:collagenase-like PrtC family protease
MGKQYGISPEELAWRQRQPAAVNGSVFDRKNKKEVEPEPELTREEMDKLAQTRVDALKVSGRLPSPDQVIRDVEDLIAEVHPRELRSRRKLTDRVQ